MPIKALGFFDKAKYIKCLLPCFYGLCVILVVADLFSHGHKQHPWEQLPAFYAIFGLLVCLVLVLFAKLLSNLIKVKVGYYDA